MIVRVPVVRDVRPSGKPILPMQRWHPICTLVGFLLAPLPIKLSPAGLGKQWTMPRALGGLEEAPGSQLGIDPALVGVAI